MTTLDGFKVRRSRCYDCQFVKVPADDALELTQGYPEAFADPMLCHIEQLESGNDTTLCRGFDRMLQKVREATP